MPPTYEEKTAFETGCIVKNAERPYPSIKKREITLCRMNFSL
jgi:hypothetical protein